MTAADPDLLPYEMGLEPGLEPGFDVPALPGASEDEIEPPALVVDLDAMEANLRAMAERNAAAGVKLRAHAKSHRSPELALEQIRIGGAIGVCCQKIAEAEAMVRGGVRDVFVTNEIVDPRKMARAARLARQARVIVMCDDARVLADWSAAAISHDVTLEMAVEIDCGTHLCGVDPGEPAAELAARVAATPGLRFAGLQAYHGAAQHIRDAEERRAAIEAAADAVRLTLTALEARGLPCPMVGGAGTGSWEFEAASGVWTEMQCGSYLFMDADYQRVAAAEGQGLGAFANSLFLMATVISKRPGRAVCDAGLKVTSLESGPPRIEGVPGARVIGCSDEHGRIEDPEDRLDLGDRVRLIPGHCDPTVNLHAWIVGLRRGRVERLIRVAARGRSL